jgi:hypothetical protein
LGPSDSRYTINGRLKINGWLIMAIPKVPLQTVLGARLADSSPANNSRIQ